MNTIGKRKQTIELTQFATTTADVKVLHQKRHASTDVLVSRIKNFFASKDLARSSVEDAMRKGSDSLTQNHRFAAISPIKTSLKFVWHSIKQLFSGKTTLPPKTLSSDELVAELKRWAIEKETPKPSLLEWGVSEEILKNTFAYLDHPPAHLTKENVHLIKNELNDIFFGRATKAGFKVGLDALHKELDKKIVSTILIEKEVKACLQVAKEWDIEINYMDAAKKLVNYCTKNNKPSEQDIVVMTILMNKIADNVKLRDSFSPVVLNTLTTAFKKLVPGFSMP